MAIAIDSTATTSGKAVNSLAWSHTVSGSDRLLLVSISREGGTASNVVSVTLDAQNFSEIQEVTNASGSLSVWSLVAPNTGAGTITATLDTGQNRDMFCGSISFTGVEQTTPLGTHATATGTTSSISVAATSAAGELVADFFSLGTGAGTRTVGVGQTQRYNGASGSIAGDVAGGCSTEPGAASVTMSWTTPDDNWAQLAVPIKSAATGGTVEADISLGTNLVAAPGALMLAEAATVLASISGTGSAASAAMLAATGLAASGAVANLSGQVFLADLTLATASTLAPGTTFDIFCTVALPASQSWATGAAASMEAASAFGLAAGLDILAQAMFDAGLNATALTAMSVTQSGLAVNLKTPDHRTVRIGIRTESIAVSDDGRSMHIPKQIL